MKAFLRDHRAQAAVPAEQRTRHANSSDWTQFTTRSANDHRYQALDMISREAVYADAGEEGYFSGMSIKMDAISIHSTKIGDEASPSRPGDETWKCTREARDMFARLGQAAEA